jgi:Protein of unknown function (DUF2752)
MTGQPSRDRKGAVLPAVFAAMLLLELAAAHVLLTADRDTVFFEGKPIHSACSFKQHFGVPCPACGISRSLVMTLHGDVATASVLNPGGPLAILTTLYFAAAMVWLALRRKLRPSADFARTTKVIQWSTALLGVALIAAVGVHWIYVLRA